MMKLLIATGASSGIGLAIAARFLDDGWSVVNISRPCPVPEVANIVCDLSEAGVVDALREPLASRLDTASRECLIHNTATMTPVQIPLRHRKTRQLYYPLPGFNLSVTHLSGHDTQLR